MARWSVQTMFYGLLLVGSVVLAITFTIKRGLFTAKPLQKSLATVDGEENYQVFSNASNGCMSGPAQKDLAKNLKHLALDLMDFQRSLTSFAQPFNRVNKQLEMVNQILEILQDDQLPNSNSFPQGIPPAKSTAQKQEVCPERFKGKDLTYGSPYWRKGFERVDCKEFVSIENLITLLMYIPEELAKPSMNYLEIMQGVEKHYPKMKVILATAKAIKDPTKSSIAQLNIVFKNEVVESFHQAKMWDKLVKQVETPYVLLAPHITHFDDDIDLYRLVRMISYNAGRVSVTGGSYRDVKGHWNLGCQQVTFRNWTASYKGGYYHSFNECVVCDFLPGPFAARTSVLKDLGVDERMSYGYFHDMFWRLHKRASDNIVLVCSDVMFKINTREIKDEEYVNFANKHAIKKIVDPDGRVHWYGCRRGFSYTKSSLCSIKDGIGVPPCDLANLADVIKTTMKICETEKIVCEFGAGTLLGAVKFGSVLPWEKDADIIFLSSNFTAIENVKSKFQQAGFSISGNKRTYGCCDETGRIRGGWFDVVTTRWRLELYGRPWLESHDMLNDHQLPTRVPLDGEWFIGPRNPGLFARNHYGYEIFRHVEHHGGWSFYHGGKFKTCPSPGHSACLDQYPADGNMQFSDYLP